MDNLACRRLPSRLRPHKDQLGEWRRDRRGRLLFVNYLPTAWFVSRGATAFEIFRRGSPPVETVPGESRGSGHRTSRSNVFVIVELSVPVSVKSVLGQITCPNSGTRLNLRLSCLKQKSLRICSFLSAESKLPFANYLQTGSFASRPSSAIHTG